MDALALLALQIDWGADEALAETAVNRLATPPAARPAIAAPVIAAPARLAGTPATSRAGVDAFGADALGANALAGVADLAALRAAMAGFTGCALRDTATHTVAPEGDPASGLLLIGEPPGAEDDRAGRPFQGPAGTVLDRLLAAGGRGREDILLAPLIPWRPPGSRPPTDAEIAQCLPFLHRLITLAAPRWIVLSGILPARALLGAGAGPRRKRGQWTELALPGAEPIPVLPIAGLASLKTAAERRALWAEWRLLHRAILQSSS